jgi:hypothetical protein
MVKNRWRARPVSGLLGLRFQSRALSAFAACALLALNACGGGGGSGAPTSAPVVTPPPVAIPKAWGEAGLIETSNSDAFRPQIAMDANGNALAVWGHFDGTRTNVWANSFR